MLLKCAVDGQRWPVEKCRLPTVDVDDQHRQLPFSRLTADSSFHHSQFGENLNANVFRRINQKDLTKFSQTNVLQNFLWIFSWGSMWQPNKQVLGLYLILFFICKYNHALPKAYHVCKFYDKFCKSWGWHFHFSNSFFLFFLSFFLLFFLSFLQSFIVITWIF